jgi:hypothetical protein
VGSGFTRKVAALLLYETPQKRTYCWPASIGDESFSGYIRQEELPDPDGPAACQCRQPIWSIGSRIPS